MDVNGEISYQWPFEWDAENMGQQKPIVNRLLKAMIEKDVDEMNDLFAKGATIKAIDESTFRRALFHLLGEYPVIKCLVENGYTGIYGGYSQECIEPATYSWGILARAWYIGNYDVFELLAQNGFDDLYLCSNGEGYYGEELIIRKNDIRATNILMENGYSREAFLCYKYINKYPESDVIRFLQDNPIIHRKTVMLDKWKFKEIPLPKMEKTGFFNKKSVEQRNSILMKDYEDRVSAQKRFKEFIGIEKWNNIVKDNEEFNKVFSEVANDILKSKRL